MPSALLLFGLTAATIIFAEGVLWLLFRARSQSIQFPRSTDASDLRFFTLGRIRLCALLHTTVLLSMAFATFFLLW